MQHDAQRVAEAREWLQRAVADLESAAVLVGSTPSHPDTALYHAQQAAEKAWKALLFWHDVPFRKTHDLRELGDACARLDGSLHNLAERGDDLTPFAWVFRYPGGPPIPSSEEAEEALQLAYEVFDAILARLPTEVRP
ncbi:MAG: HEPN domain-containing protein [Chloroflexota bacterium]